MKHAIKQNNGWKKVSILLIVASISLMSSQAFALTFCQTNGHGTFGCSMGGTSKGYCVKNIRSATGYVCLEKMPGLTAPGKGDSIAPVRAAAELKGNLKAAHRIQKRIKKYLRSIKKLKKQLRKLARKNKRVLRKLNSKQRRKALKLALKR